MRRGRAAVILKSIDGGTTWTPQTSGTANSLSGVACVNAGYCFADGTVGTTHRDGERRRRRGRSRATRSAGRRRRSTRRTSRCNGAACTSARCLVGLGVQGDILTTPLLTVTVHASGVYGTAPNLAGLAPGNPAISYSPAGEAGNVTGTLTCTTTAVSREPGRLVPDHDCSGLADDGFNVVYDYANSNYTVTKAPLTVTADNKSRLFGQANPPLTATLSGFVLGQTLATSGVTGSRGLHDDRDAVQRRAATTRSPARRGRSPRRTTASARSSPARSRSATRSRASPGPGRLR